MIYFSSFAEIVEAPGTCINDDAIEILDNRLKDEGIPHAFVIKKTEEEMDKMKEQRGDVYICDVAYDTADETKVTAVLFLWAAADLGFEEKHLRRMMKKYINS